LDRLDRLVRLDGWDDLDRFDNTGDFNQPDSFGGKRLGCTPYRRSATCGESFGCELKVERLPSASSGLEPVESSRVEYRRMVSLAQRFQPVGAGACAV
jgi:hypothetical protein